MLPVHYDARILYTPPSSPPSPASRYQDSSSPPSSPSHDPLSLDSDCEPDVEHAFSSSLGAPDAPIDPLSGAYHSSRVKRRSHAFTPVHTPKKRTRYRSRSPHMLVDDEDAAEALLSPRAREKQRQKLLWDAELEKIFRGGEREIDLRCGACTCVCASCSRCVLLATRTSRRCLPRQLLILERLSFCQRNMNRWMISELDFRRQPPLPRQGGAPSPAHIRPPLPPDWALDV